jgi:hypothetical protein
MTDDDPRNNIIQVRKFKNKADADAVRERTLQHFVYRVIDTLKKQTGLTEQVNSGLLEFESFIEALEGGGSHPKLETWLQRRKGTPPADARELRARRLIVLMTIALERTSMPRSMAEARRFAAKETNAAHVFPGETITAKAIEHWHDRQPELTRWDEQLVATAIASIGMGAPRRLATYFVGLAHFAHNPSVTIVMEGNR